MRFGGRCIFLKIFSLSIYFLKIKEEKYIKNSMVATVPACLVDKVAKLDS
jgi:hypothetical protein